MKNFQKNTFVIFDVETTGLSVSNGDRIIEVAALKIKNLRPIGHFHSFVNPQREISSGAFAVNRITYEMLCGSPTAQEILPELLDFFGESILVGHNIKFDLEFLRREVFLAGLDWKEKVMALCTVKMARTLLPEMGRYPLWLVAQTLGLDTLQEHRALSDVYLTWSVFRRLLAVANRRDLTDLEMFLPLFAVQPGPEQEKRIKENISLIEQAIEFKKTILISYFSSSQGAMTFRKVNPQRIVKEKGQMKLLGFCHLRGEDRSFRLDRILRLDYSPDNALDNGCSS